MTISFSRYLAIVLGILTPLGETIRRWHTWQENPPAFFDDYIIWVAVIKGAGLALGIVALVVSLRRLPETSRTIR